MKTIAGTWWLMAAVLVLAVTGDVPVEELTEIQNEGIGLVMDEFHNKAFLKSGFKVSSVLRAEQVEYAAGIFVNLEFTVKQTNCPRNGWTRSDCKVLKNGNVFNCFGCYKFEYETHKVLSRVTECVRQIFVKDRAEHRKKTCKEVEMRHAGQIRVGSYSFLKHE